MDQLGFGRASERPADPAAPLTRANPAPLVESLETTLLRTARLTKQALPGVDEVSVTVIEAERPRTVVFTGPLAMQLDERQYADEKGPCLDAAVSGRTITVDHRDLAGTPYPSFSAAAGRAGIAHTVSVALPDTDRVTGGLNIYGSAALPFEDPVITLAKAFAAQMSVGIANATQYRLTAEVVAQLQAAIESRSVIEQAKGIIMGRDGCHSDEAFAVLVRMSQNQNIKLRAVAQDLVAAARTWKVDR